MRVAAAPSTSTWSGTLQRVQSGTPGETLMRSDRGFIPSPSITMPVSVFSAVVWLTPTAE